MHTLNNLRVYVQNNYDEHKSAKAVKLYKPFKSLLW